MNIEFYTYSFLNVLTNLYHDLNKSHNELKGRLLVDRFSYEQDFELEIIYQTLGQVMIKANFRCNDDFGNECTICFNTDQTFITYFLREMKEELAL